MKLKHIILSAFISTIFWGKTQAQTVDESVLFSKEDNAGSARIKGMGNVQTAIGGDVSSVSGNPAGLGFYTRSDISATFNLLGNNYQTDYLGTSNKSNKTNFGIDQAGAVFYLPTYNSSGWQNFNVGINFNKTQNYNSKLAYSGVNSNSTFVNAITDLMARNNDFSNNLDTSGIVDEFGDPSYGYFPIAIENGDKNQYNEILSKGYKGKTSLSFGANYNNTFYIGASVGFTAFEYQKATAFVEKGYTKTANEIIVDNPNSTFGPGEPNNRFTDANYELFDRFNQVTQGTGVDLKIGAIYKPTTDWNIGLTVATPTWMTIQDQTRAYTDVDYYDNATSTTTFHVFRSNYYDSNTEYNMTTPWKFSFGLTKFFNRGLISADIDYITYNTTRYSTVDGFAFQDLNKSIKNNLQGVANFRVGGEYLFTNVISGRAGFNYFGNPYKNATGTNYNGSLGLGFKLSNTIYLDLAVTHEVFDYNTAPYTLSDFWQDKGLYNPIANISNQRTSGILTIGAKF